MVHVILLFIIFVGGMGVTLLIGKTIVNIFMW